MERRLPLGCAPSSSSSSNVLARSHRLVLIGFIINQFPTSNLGEEATARVEGDTAKDRVKRFTEWQAARYGEKIAAQSDYIQIYATVEKQSKMVSGLRKSLSETWPSTLNRPLRRGAAEGAGERRGDVGSDDLLGRFFGRRFFTG